MRYAIGVCVDGHYQIEGLLGQGGAGGRGSTISP